MILLEDRGFRLLFSSGKEGTSGLFNVVLNPCLATERGRPPSTKASGRLGYWDFNVVDYNGRHSSSFSGLKGRLLLHIYRC